MATFELSVHFPTTWAETPAFATERYQLLMFAVVTNNTQKSVFKTTTLKKFGKLFFHIAW